ncbi:MULTISPECIES: hypothetical protein [unclassified Arthrobacter]|uniref:hypothetical protein n=1 Tax=unclassified Arthrobacter TaxID=235627 RepID=UPI000CE43673|nr:MULTISPECIES: hypothetical protein [unclassified Arthrobacter]
MSEHDSSKVNDHAPAIAQGSIANLIWCGVCDSDEYVIIERARWYRLEGEGSWDIDYTCMNCDSFYGHVVKEAEVTRALMAAMAVVAGN